MRHLPLLAASQDRPYREAYKVALHQGMPVGGARSVLRRLLSVESGPGWQRRETIETTISALGAGFVGLGVGLVLGIQESAIGWTLLLGGLLAHSTGMVFLHRRRKGHGDEQPAWLEYYGRSRSRRPASRSSCLRAHPGPQRATPKHEA